MSALFHSTYNKEQAVWEARLGDEKVLEYVYDVAADPNPSFRIVRTPTGQDIAAYHPWDHIWHTGLFFSWKYINGLNFWEAMYHGERNRVVTEGFEPMDASSGTGFRQSLAYVTEGGTTLVKEERRIQIEPEENGYLIRWHAAFRTAGDAEVTLDRTPITPESPWGGYAGLSCRLQRNYLGPVVTTDRGIHTADDAHAQAYRWCDYAGKLDGFAEQRMAGICLMDHPSNPRFPTHMLTYDYKDMQFVQAAFLCHEPYVLKCGDLLALSYAVYVHDGEAAAETLERVWNRVVSE